jgi:hypothetical protein
MKDSAASSSQPTNISAPEPFNNSEPTTDIEQVTKQDIDLHEGARDKGLKNPLVMILSSILWMTYPRHFQRHMHH